MPFWRRAFWRSYWIALQRSGKDKRARRIAGTVSLLIVYIPIYILIFFVLPFRTREGVWQILFDGFIFGAGGVAFVLLRRSHRHQNDLLNYSITGAEPRDIIPKKVAPAVQDYLKERSIILATLLLRGCGELLIARPDLTHGFEVIAR